MRSDCGADQVEGRLNVGYPVPDGFIDRIFKGAAAAGHRAYLGAQQFHAEDIERLAPDVLLAHVNDAFEAHHTAYGRTGNSMLPIPCLSNDTPFSHTFCP